MAQDLDDPRLTREINKKIGHNRLDDSIYKHRERTDHFKENAALNPRRHALAGLAVGAIGGLAAGHGQKGLLRRALPLAVGLGLGGAYGAGMHHAHKTGLRKVTEAIRKRDAFQAELDKRKA
jgi:hypothetical protein